MWNDPLALNRLTAMLLVVALVIAGVTGVRWLARQPQFAIRTVVVTPVEGQELQHVTAERVARCCVPQINGTIFTADLAQARNAFESLPWVRKASVRRQWPDRLVVHLEEHRALARWNDESGNRFVSLLGEAFNAPGETELGRALPLLSGPEGSEREVARHYGAFRERLATIGKDPKVVTLSPRQAWTVRLADGMVLEIGREQQSSTVLSRLERFVAQYALTIGRIATRVEVVDLRYPNGFAARVPGLRATLMPDRPQAAGTPQRKPKQPQRIAKPAAGRA